MKAYCAALLIALAATACSAQQQQRKLLHGGHAHEEEAATPPPVAMVVPQNSTVMSVKYANWFDYLNKTGHESPTDFILDSLQAPGTVNNANLSEVLYVVSQSQCAPPLNLHQVLTSTDTYRQQPSTVCTAIQEPFSNQPATKNALLCGIKLLQYSTYCAVFEEEVKGACAVFQEHHSKACAGLTT